MCFLIKPVPTPPLFCKHINLHNLYSVPIVNLYQISGKTLYLGAHKCAPLCSQTLIIQTCFPGLFFFLLNIIRCDLQKLKWLKVHLSFQTCLNHYFDLFWNTNTWNSNLYVHTGPYINASRSKFIIKFCFLYSLCLHYYLSNIHIFWLSGLSIIQTVYSGPNESG